MATTRSKKDVYLLGSYVKKLTGSKLPSVRMTLGFFLYQHLELHKTIRESSAVTVKEISLFWSKARIPIRDEQNCQTKLEKTFESWRLLKKNKGRKSMTQKTNEQQFTMGLDDLFDIAHANALSMMTIQEDKDFLVAQREKGRKGSMAGIDMKLVAKEKRLEKSQAKAERLRLRLEAEAKIANETVVLLSSSTSTESSEDEKPGTSQDIPIHHASKRRRGL